MSARTRKSTTRTSSIVSAGDLNIPDDSLNGGSDSFGSNASGRLTRTRVEEKQKLSGLNDRLAQYIERVRQLESENENLQTRIKEVEVVERRERDDANAQWIAKIDEIRKELDRANEVAQRAEINRKRAEALTDDLRPKVQKLTTDLASTAKDRERLANRLSQLDADLARHREQSTRLGKENEELRADLESALNQKDGLSQQVEDECLMRSNLQNKINALEENLEILKKMHDEELQDIYRRRDVEIVSIQRQQEKQYHEQIQLRVKELRKECDARIQESRQELENKWRQRVDEDRLMREAKDRQLIEVREEVSQLRSRVSTADAENARLRAAEADYQKQIRDLDARLRITQEKLRAKDEEIARLQDEVDHLNQEYQNLIEVKIQLDNELATYHELLNAEETRLKIRSPENSADDSDALHVSFADQGSPRRGVKRRRLVEESHHSAYSNRSPDRSVAFERTAEVYRTNEHATGNVSVSLDPTDPSFIRIDNHGETDLSIAAWALVAQDGTQEVRFRFHNRQAIKAGKTVVVWSANASADHPTGSGNLALKNQNWPTGDERRVALVNNENVEVAFSERYRSSRVSESSEERCSIM